MSEKQQKTTGPQPLLSDWMKTATEIWGPIFSMWNNIGEANGEISTSKKEGKKSRVQESFETTQKTWQALSSVMIEPETMGALFKGTGVLPEIFLKMAQTNLDSFVRFQRQWVEKAGKIGKTTQAYKFEDLDEDVFKAWTELYEKEFRRFLNIPQVGLTRFYQEKVMRTVDKFNIFQATMAEFMRLLFLPVEKSLPVMQEKLTELADEGNLPEDPKAYYQIWIKILEGHYMTLFQSLEYTLSMNKTLDSLTEFSTAKKEILQDVILHMLPVPTQKEMDELYKDIYVLKKRIRKLEKGK
jgi:hypothetical protein